MGRERLLTYCICLIAAGLLLGVGMPLRVAAGPSDLPPRPTLTPTAANTPPPTNTLLPTRTVEPEKPPTVTPSATADPGQPPLVTTLPALLPVTGVPMSAWPWLLLGAGLVLTGTVGAILARGRRG